ncbi:MAG: DM13 domain-containing protein [Pseudomonadota bacterium]
MTRLLSIFRIMLVSIGLGLAATASVKAEGVAAGGWDNQEYKISGDWKIVEEDGKRFFVLSDDFRTRNGPDLKIFFSTLPADEVRGNNVVSTSTRLAVLDKNKGGQRYEIPAELSLEDVKSVAIHCEQFSKLWGAGNL